MDDPSTGQDDLSREIARALDSVDEKAQTLFLAKPTLKFGHQLGDLKEVSLAIEEARREIDN